MRCPDDGETAASRGEIGTSLPHLDSTRLLLGLTSSEDDSQDQPRPQLRRRACAVDRHFGLEDKFTPDELALLLKTRAFVDDEVLPTIGGFWEPAGFPRDLAKRMGELGLVGDGIEGHGCPPMSPMAPELVNMELNRRDGSLGTFPGVQSGLAMQSIDMLGSTEQKQRWLPGLASVDLLGASSPSRCTARTRRERHAMTSRVGSFPDGGQSRPRTAPPSTPRAVPLMKPACCEHRKAMT